MLLLLFLNHHSIAKTNLFVNVFHTVCLPFLKMIRLADFLAVIPGLRPYNCVKVKHQKSH
ncbi:hypothetical protein EWI11_09335 [Enterococcus faecium]|uniref:Uncharacterized protein n=1 Tax=Enterococcus faecium TaxID=1352 RepID=A0A7V8C6Z5_ENTFC|nr:hypothetical protein B4W81_03165 [Enterococcus faecium]KAB7545839.1 hypothetical protein GBM46_01320 [Enterococcus faecium]KAB7577362.1 hypothetical protein GBM73_08550 [Enterococcus faecium]KAB7588186.1 hypothetical protein GBM52_01320 [Enterococcus faecium]KAB7591986.1 hypothetical protein GBM82_01305 [Enterococcus faecium]